MSLYFLVVWCVIYVFGTVNGIENDGIHVIQLQSYRSSLLPTFGASKLVAPENIEGGENVNEDKNDVDDKDDASDAIAPLPSEGAGAGSASLNSFNDVLWYTTITVGTGAGQQQLTVDVDTGSADLIIPGAMCGASCNGHKTYNPKTSPTSRRSNTTFAIDFADKSYVNGTIYADDVSLGGLTVKNHAFGLASTYSDGMKKSTFDPDGLLGFGFSTLSKIDTPNFIDTLYNQQKIKKRVFGVRLDRSGADGERGELTLGGYNEKHIQGNIAYAPVTDQKFWQTQLDQVSIGNKVMASNQKFVVDTGSTLINADDAFVTKVYSTIEGSKRVENTKYWTLPCAKIPTLVITIGGIKFTIDPTTFSPGPVKESSDLCYGGIVSNVATNDPWIMGGVFLTNVYTIFDVDQKRVGFSQLKGKQKLDQ